MDSRDLSSMGLIQIGSLVAVFDDPRIPQSARDALIKGRYELKEREVVRRFLNAGDRVVELGAGMGVLSMAIAQIVGGEALLSFEANAIILEIAKINAIREGYPITFFNEIACPSVIAKKNSSVQFFPLKSFAASSTRRVSGGQVPVEIPTVSLEEVIDQHRANILIFDIEGYEDEIISLSDLRRLEGLVFEIHPKILGRERCISLIEHLEAIGFVLRRDLIFGDVLAFDRRIKSEDISGSCLFNDALDFESYMVDKNYDMAYEVSKRLDSVLNNNPYYQYQKSIIERAQGRDGILSLESSVSLGSNDFLLFADLCGQYCKLGRMEEAVSALNRLEFLFPNCAFIPSLTQSIRNKQSS